MTTRWWFWFLIIAISVLAVGAAMRITGTTGC